MPALGRLFRYASLVHLIVASVITLLIAYEPLEIPRVIAGGSAGMWFTMGYLMYLIAGPLGSLYFSLIYSDKRSSIGLLAFLMYNAGVLIASFSLIYGGYHAGWMMHVYPVHHQGNQIPTQQIHLWLVNFVLPAGIGTILAGLGALIGAIGALISERKAP
ncbi:MAG: hypothetical protein NZ992_06110 [Candidatus Korarchaeum sp.]|nr:hypothetical protein [Candidatus Korarchaeum sp.]MDW8035574.1 hypothetical protein [Candidatus Korarchaeum sp.]